MTTVNAASLYDIYIRFWLQRDDWRSYLNIDERLDLANSIAEYIFINNIKTIHYSSIPDINFNLISNHANYSADIYDYELRTCNFLRRDHDGNYSFVHKSFLEFLLAKQIFIQITGSERDTELKWKLPLEKLTSLSDNLVASIETEDFFLELTDIWLREMTGDVLKEKIVNKHRTKYILSKACAKLNWEDYYGFYVELLLDPNANTDIELIADRVLRNDNWLND